MKFEVVFNIYEWNDSGLYGALHIELDGRPFPEKRWTGSLSETLIMWTENLFSLFEADLNGEEEFFFPQSAFSFTLRQSGIKPAKLQLQEKTKPLDNPAFEVSFFSVVLAVFGAIEAVIGDERLEKVQQIKRLKNMASRLKKVSEAHGYHMD